MNHVFANCSNDKEIYPLTVKEITEGVVPAKSTTACETHHHDSMGSTTSVAHILQRPKVKGKDSS
jgi:hypothetical protein